MPKWVVCYPDVMRYVARDWPAEDIKRGVEFDPGWLLTARRDTAQEFDSIEEAIACVLIMESQTDLRAEIIEADKAVL